MRFRLVTSRAAACVGTCSVLFACGGPAPRALDSLELRDSLYVDEATGVPFSGPVVRPFPDGGVQVEGSLTQGLWDGDFRVYHPNGRIRYMGAFDAGQRCGPWTENADSLAESSVYQQLLDEIESLGLYPPCTES